MRPELKVQLEQSHTGGDYLLRDIPRDLWDACKHRVIIERITLRELILRALRRYLEGGKGR